MDTIMTLIPIVVAILSGLWVAYHRKHKTPWIKTWLKVIAVLIGLPVCAYMGAKGLGLTDANVKWLIGPLTLMLFSGIASVVGIFGYGIIRMLINVKHRPHEPGGYEDDYEVGDVEEDNDTLPHYESFEYEFKYGYLEACYPYKDGR